MDIGSNIRAIRKQKQITISQLCEGTGLSKGFLSQVENNKTSPSISTLDSIAKFLNVPLAYLLLEKNQGMRVVRKSERQYTTFGKDQLKVEHLAAFGNLRLLIVESPPGTSSGEQPHAHKGIESHLVLKGTFEARQGEDVAILHEGDSFSWTACVPHMVKNIGNETGFLLIASYKEEEEG
jgi:transcriptional regulator with XRE-family HTH domain